jgi:hypothetical protein
MPLLTLLQSDKKALHRTRVVREPLPDDPRPGEALLKIDRVAVTTNNVTYAAFGDVPHLRYWSFFPTGEEGWGHIPAWGFADVVASAVDGIAAGERFFGYWPIASHLRVEPERVNDRRFFDGTKHRKDLTAIYNQYLKTSADPAYRPEDEDHIMLLRPLFTTSCMLADFLQDNRFFGARALLVSSASSKTAYGTAFCLQSCLPHEPNLAVVGLTSPGNRAFVEGLGCYTETVTYDAVETMDPRVPTVYVDLSGDQRLRVRVHRHLGASLAYDCFAGSAQSHAFPVESDVQGPAPKPYFAPIQIAKRNQDWGPSEVSRKLSAWERAFIERVRCADRPWMQVHEHVGFDAAQRVVEDLCIGRLHPREGHVVVLG